MSDPQPRHGRSGAPQAPRCEPVHARHRHQVQVLLWAVMSWQLHLWLRLDCNGARARFQLKHDSLPVSEKRITCQILP
jgi:hypothetical protein